MAWTNPWLIVPLMTRPTRPVHTGQTMIGQRMNGKGWAPELLMYAEITRRSPRTRIQHLASCADL